MKRKKSAKLALIALLLNLALSAQPMEKITFYDLKASDKAESIDYYFQEEKKIFLTPLEINMEMEANEPGNILLIFSKDTARQSTLKDSFVIRFASIQEEEKFRVFLQVQKCFKENEVCSEIKKNIIKIDTEKNKILKEILSKNKGKDPSTTIKFDILIEKKEIKIIYSRNIIFSEAIDTEDVFGKFAYFQLE